MNDELPTRRNLESLRKEAKRWLDALRAGSTDARTRMESALGELPVRLTLREVQRALAREHGFDGWTSMKEAIAHRTAAGGEALARYEAMADALLEAYRTGTPEAMERHYRYTWHRRAWPTMRTYVQLDLGKRPANPGDDVEITLDDARHLVAREYGFADWTELQTYTRSLPVGVRTTAKPMRIVERGASSGEHDWELIAASRNWDEIIEVLKQHPEAGLSAEGQMTDALLGDLGRVEHLTGLSLGGCRDVTDDGIRHLARLPRLQFLNLAGTAVTDAGLQVLRSLPQLKTLSLSWTRITDAGAAALEACGELEHLDLSATAAGDGALRALAGNHSLRRLVIALTDDGIPLLHHLPVFKSWQGGENHLALQGTFSDPGMQHLRGLDGLFGLDIPGSVAITAVGLPPLTHLPHLESLSVDAKDDWMQHIAAIPHLRTLSVQDTVAGDDGFEALSRSQSIESIWGRRCHNLRTRGFVALSRMPALRSLSVSCLNVEDAGIATLPEFPALRELMPMDVPDAGYRHIARCLRLQTLTLMYCRETTDAATEHITGLPNLTTYFNSYTRITDRTPELLSTMDPLERITFDTCHGLTNEGVARLARLPKLRELHASGNRITPALRDAFPSRVRVR